MALISDRDREIIKTHFDENLASEVQIKMFTEHQSPIIIPGRTTCETCQQTEQLLGEVASLSDKIDLTILELEKSRDEASGYGIDRVPAFIVTGASRGRVRFFGIPSGYEFSAFIEDLIDVSRGATDLSEETREYLAGLTTEVNIKVFTTPT
jgi:glutaredoxin-like protein